MSHPQDYGDVDIRNAYHGDSEESPDDPYHSQSQSHPTDMRYPEGTSVANRSDVNVMGPRRTATVAEPKAGQPKLSRSYGPDDWQ